MRLGRRKGRQSFPLRRERDALSVLRPAEFGAGPAPGVAVLGPENYQKEQAPALYPARVAQLGYAALVFDPRFRGESGGEPRCYEDPLAKIDDVHAAFDYLSSRSDVDSGRLALVGICFGGSFDSLAVYDARRQVVDELSHPGFRGDSVKQWDGSYRCSGAPKNRDPIGLRGVDNEPHRCQFSDRCRPLRGVADPPIFAIFDVTRFATGYNRLRPLGSINAPWLPAASQMGSVRLRV